MDQPTREWSARDIDLMLAVLSVIESPGFEIAATVYSEASSGAEGRRIVHMPYPRYHPVVDEFWRLCYNTSAFIDPYALLPEDPRGTDPEMGATQVLSSVTAIEGATADQIRRYFIQCTRAERFFDGHIAEEFAQGRLAAAVRRLRVLRRDLDG